MSRRIDVIDNVTTNKTIGIGLPLCNSSGIFNTTKTTTDQIKFNIYNLLLTNSGERILIPHFGCNLRKLTFSQLTNNNDSISLSDIKDTIREQIKTYIPNVSVKKLDLILSNNNTLQVHLDFTLNKNSTIIDTIEINIPILN